MKIGVIGLGTVGSVVYESFQTLGHDLSYFDTAHADSKINDVLDTEVVFVSVPTNMNENDGSCDTSIVEEVVDILNSYSYSGIVVVKSTVLPGTTDSLAMKYKKLKICFSPEFLRQKTALSDFLYNQDVLVIGSHDGEIQEYIAELHEKLCKNVKFLLPTEAEIVKYFNNVHNAVNVVFANMMYDVCEQLDCSYENVYDTIEQRNCINTSYLNCNKNLRAYGGDCLPKDISAWNKMLKEIGLQYTFLDHVIKDNELIKNESTSNRS
jgi:UDPglucose 6-dehydrogenase